MKKYAFLYRTSATYKNKNLTSRRQMLLTLSYTVFPVSQECSIPTAACLAHPLSVLCMSTRLFLWWKRAGTTLVCDNCLHFPSVAWLHAHARYVPSMLSKCSPSRSLWLIDRPLFEIPLHCSCSSPWGDTCYGVFFISLYDLPTNKHLEIAIFSLGRRRQSI